MQLMNTILDLYRLTRQRTEALCEPLQVEDYTPQSALFASPPKWHIAHVTWFFEEMILKKYIPNYQVFVLISTLGNSVLMDDSSFLRAFSEISIGEYLNW